MITFVLSLAACTNDKPPLPEKIQGLWELHQVETAGGQVDALDTVLARYPGCTWGRMTWTFEADHLKVGHDVLCPGAMDEYYGCEVAARVPAVWNETAGSWKVEYPVAVRSRTVGMGDDRPGAPASAENPGAQRPDELGSTGALGVPTSCEVTLAAGDYPVARVRNQDWRWEMRTPDGTVYRLRLPESDRPDFVAAIQSARPGDVGAAEPAPAVDDVPKENP